MGILRLWLSTCVLFWLSQVIPAQYEQPEAIAPQAQPSAPPKTITIPTTEGLPPLVISVPSRAPYAPYSSASEASSSLTEPYSATLRPRSSSQRPQERQPVPSVESRSSTVQPRPPTPLSRHETRPPAYQPPSSGAFAPTNSNIESPRAPSVHSQPSGIRAPSPPARPSFEANAQQAPQSAPPQRFDGTSCIADNIFVIDSTSSVKDIFEKHREYAENIIQQLDISDQGHHVGIIEYASKYRNRVKISLADPQRKENVTKHVHQLPFMAGVTATGAALRLALKELALRRPNVRANLIVITDGFSYDYVEEPIEELKKVPNLRRFAVSIGRSQNLPELELIASGKDFIFHGGDSYRSLLQKLLGCEASGTGALGTRSSIQQKERTGFQAPTGPESLVVEPPQDKLHELRLPYDQAQQQPQADHGFPALSNVPSAQVEANEVSGYEFGAGQVASQTQEPVESSISQKDCKYDLLIVLDISGSLRTRFERQIQLAENIINTFPVSQLQTHIGIIKYSGRDKSFIVLPLNNTYDKNGIRRKLHGIRFIGGTTWTGQALLKALDELTGPSSRSEAKKIVMLFTDGFSWEDPIPAAKQFQSKGIPIFALGINHDYAVNIRELEQIAGRNDHVFLDADVNALQTLLNSLTQTCA